MPAANLKDGDVVEVYEHLDDLAKTRFKGSFVVRMGDAGTLYLSGENVLDLKPGDLFVLARARQPEPYHSVDMNKWLGIDRS